MNKLKGGKKKSEKGDEKGEVKSVSLIDQIIQDLKPKRRKKKEEDLTPEEAKLRNELGDALLKKMSDADDEDRGLYAEGKPAIRKMKLLPTVIIQCSK
jgi:uncharacterized protein YnzC (UPF0291/DUF896 family)